MRRFLVVLAAMPALARAADFSAGTIALRGSSTLGLSSSSSKVSDSTSTGSFTFVGFQGTSLFYAVPNVGLGLNLGYSYSESKGGGLSESFWALGVGPAIELDLPVAEQVTLFAEGTIGYQTSRATSNQSSFRGKSSGFGAGVFAGMKYFPAKAFSVDAGLAYDYTESRSESGSFGSSPTAKFSRLGLNVGLSVYFGR